MAKPCFLIVNPTSGSFSQPQIDRIIASLTLSGLDPILLKTGSAMDPTLFASRICAEIPHPLIIVAGGDGTVNGVLNGLTPGAATLAVIPLGTSNVLARELKIHSVDDALKRLAAGKSRPAPVGEVRNSGNKWLFILMAGVGVDGSVVQRVRLREKRALGKGAYALSALRLLRDWDRSEMKVACNGKSFSCHSVIVCNASRYGGNFILAPQGDIFSPGFQVVCIKGGVFTYLKLACQLALGRVADSSSVTITGASELEIKGGKAVQLDGDYLGSGGVRFRSIPDFVRLIV